jgi:hypothetical protein
VEQDEKLMKAIANRTELKRWPLPGIPSMDTTWARLPTLLAALGQPPLSDQVKRSVRPGVDQV